MDTLTPQKREFAKHYVRLRDQPGRIWRAALAAGCCATNPQQEPTDERKRRSLDSRGRAILREPAVQALVTELEAAPLRTPMTLGQLLSAAAEKSPRTVEVGLAFGRAVQHVTLFLGAAVVGAVGPVEPRDDR